jgi:hypothetical protein
MRLWLSDVWWLWELQTSQDVLADADVPYDQAAVLRSTMKGTACPSAKSQVISNNVMCCTLQERELVTERCLL